MAEKTGRKDPLSLSELSAFCAQIAMIMKSGIPVAEGIAIMCEDMKNPQGKEIMAFLQEQVELGEPLHKALEASGRFPKYMVDMAEIGETTGRLEEVMDNLCIYYEREEAIAQSVRSAVTYPLIMVVMMVAVITVLIVKVLPIFNQVFIQLGSEMTGFSRGVMTLGQGIGRYAFVIIGVIAALIVAYLILRGTEGGRRILQRWNARFFATKKLNAKIASGRFASAMSLMLASGLDTDQSLDMVHKLIDNEFIQEKITACKGYINEGVGFAESMVKADIFTGIYARMISVGFKTGSVDTVMKKLAERYEEEVDSHIAGIISILEPTLVAVLSIIVGMILLSVMLPLMGIMSSIG